VKSALAADPAHEGQRSFSSGAGMQKIPDRTIDRTGTSLACTLPGTTVTEP